MHKLFKTKIAGYTLTEAAVVIIILGGLAAIAMPRYLIQRKVICNGEGELMLQTFFEDQKEYFRDNGAYAASSANLDVSFYGQSNCFQVPTASIGTAVSCASGNYTSIAAIEAADSSYTLHISTEGAIRCDNCSSSICIKMGY